MTPQSTGYALLAQDSYRTPAKNDSIKIDGQEYTVFANADNPTTGFQATAYQRKGSSDVVIAYRGTEFNREPVHDGGVDAGMVLLGINAQAPDSIAFTKDVLAKAQKDAELNDRTANVTVTGHSLGGTLAEINAAKFGLKGETFNAYGAASLFGVPAGGNQVIDHVRAGDVVSAASPHFGEVRVYAAQQDIDTLSKAGYRDDSGVLSLRNPVKAIDFDAHAIDNFVPDSKLLGQSIISPENQARYRAHEGMVDRYRNDVMDIRKGLSASWEVPKTIGEEVVHLGKEVREGATAVGHAVSHVTHEVVDTARHVRDEVSSDLHAAGHALSEGASRGWNTMLHPSSLFVNEGSTPARIDQPGHPDHPLFRQAREGVRQLDDVHQRAPDERSDRLAASLTVAAREAGLQRIDHVALSGDASRTYAVQGDLNSPLKQVAEVDTTQAVATSLEQSSQALQQASQRDQVLADQQQQQQVYQQGRSMPGV